MIVSFPMLAVTHDVARDIAASGVSEVGFGAPTPSTAAPTGVRTAWRSPVAEGNPYLTPPPQCPECGSQLIRASACVSCPACGWGKCG